LLGTLSAVDHQRVRGHQATGHELLALTEQMRGFVDFAVHGISHRESGNLEAVAMLSGYGVRATHLAELGP
jgi:hypothetical protein